MGSSTELSNRIIQGIKSQAGTGPDNRHYCLSTNCRKELLPTSVADFSKPVPDFVFPVFRKMILIDNFNSDAWKSAQLKVVVIH